MVTAALALAGQSGSAAPSVQQISLASARTALGVGEIAGIQADAALADLAFLELGEEVRFDKPGLLEAVNQLIRTQQLQTAAPVALAHAEADLVQGVLERDGVGDDEHGVHDGQQPPVLGCGALPVTGQEGGDHALDLLAHQVRCHADDAVAAHGKDGERVAVVAAGGVVGAVSSRASITDTSGVGTGTARTGHGLAAGGAVHEGRGAEQVAVVDGDTDRNQRH